MSAQAPPEIAESEVEPHAVGTGTAPERGRLGFAILLLVLMALAMYLASALPILAPRLQTAWGLTNRQLGTLMSCSIAGTLLALPGVWLIVARLGMRWALQVAFWGLGLSYVGCSMARSPVPFEVLMVVAGLFGGMQSILGMSALVALYPAVKRRMLSVSLVATSAPAVLFPALVGQGLQALSADPQRALALAGFAPLAVIGVLALVGGTLVSRAYPQDAAALSEGERPRLRELLTAPMPLIFALAAIHGSSDGAIYTWLPRFMEASPAGAAVAPGIVLSLYSVGYMVARAAQAALPERAAQRAFLTLVGPAGAALALLAIWGNWPWGVAVLYPLGGMLWCLEYPSLLAEIRSRSAAHYSGALAGLMLITQPAVVAQMTVVGWVADRTGSLQWALTIPAVGFALFGLLAALGGLGRLKPGWQRPPSP